MTQRLAVSSREVQAIVDLGDRYQQDEWKRSAWLAAFSCGPRTLWAARIDGKSGMIEKRLDLSGLSRVLDHVADAVRKRSRIGGRFFLKEDGAYSYQEGGGMRRIVEFAYTRIDPPASQPSMPISTRPISPTCPRCGSFDFADHRCDACGMERM